MTCYNFHKTKGKRNDFGSATFPCFALTPLLSSFPSSSKGHLTIGDWRIAGQNTKFFLGEKYSPMHFSYWFCLLLTFLSVLELCNAVLPILIGCVLIYCEWSLKILTQMGDLGCRFFELGSRFNPGSVLLFFMVFGVGLRFLQCGGGLTWFIREIMGKSRVLRDGFCSKRACNDDGFLLVKEEEFRESGKSSKANGDHCLEEADDDHEVDLDEFHGTKEVFEEEEAGTEDEVSSVIALRKMVKAEKRKANAAVRDLEKERMAAASAAEEAMAMIFRLQNEKSSLQIEVNQLQRWAEEKQIYDREVIQSLEWTLMQYEEDKSLLEEQLKVCKNRLMVYEQDDQIEIFDCLTSGSPCTPLSV